MQPADRLDPSVQTLAGELRAVISKITRRLREQAHMGDLTWSQVAILGRLDREGPVTISTLARAEGMRQQSMGASVSALRTAGLVAGTPDPTDGRQTLISLTDSCREWIRANRALREDWLMQAIKTHLSADEQEDLATAIGLLQRLADS